MIETPRESTAQDQLSTLSDAFRQSNNIICIADSRLVIQYVNRWFCKATGYTSGEVIGQRYTILLSELHRPGFYHDAWHTLRNGAPWSGNIRKKKKNGEVFWERLAVSPIFGDDGKVAHYLAIGEDITGEIISQQIQAESDKQAAISILAAGVAHAFKNFLGGIIGNASYALDELKDAESLGLARETLELIIDIGDKANEVATSMLSYSHSRPGVYSMADMRPIVEQTIRLVARELNARSIQLKTYYEDVPPVKVSAARVQQLILNLLINAQQAITSDGTVTVALMCDDTNIRLTIGDTGPGISPDHTDQIFDPFFSTKGVWGSDHGTGSGIGLSICRNIALEHGGELTVESSPGRGAAFTLSLPIPESAAVETEDDTNESDNMHVAVFSSSRSVQSQYFREAVSHGIKIKTIDSTDSFSDTFGGCPDIVVCDAKFTGKIELLKVAEYCQSNEIPYVVVNSGPQNFQLADLYDDAVRTFTGLPSFDELTRCAIATAIA